jgi:parallel beta-helix repeat protein
MKVSDTLATDSHDGGDSAMPKALGLLTALLASAVFIAFSADVAAADHVHCGDVITHDTKLDADLSCTRSGFENVTGIVIGGDDITLDLGGHVITGPGIGYPDDNAIDNRGGHDGVTITNGAIRRFRTGIRFVGADAATIENVDETTVTLERGDYATVLGGEDTAVILSHVAHSTVTGLTGAPVGSSIELDASRLNAVEGNSLGGGISLSGSDHNRIANNVAGLGIRLTRDSRDNRVVQNTVSNNDYDVGVDVSLSDHNSIISNSVIRPYRGALGIRVADSRRTLVRDNSIEWQYDGIVLSRSTHTRVERNRVIGSGPYDTGDGFCQFCIIDSNHNRLRGNFAGGTPSYGMLVTGTSADNRLIANVASGGGLGGIVVRADTHDTLLERNLATRSADDDGIHIDSPLTTVRANTANDNFDFGIEAVAGVTDGGGNTAFGNGNPLQCLNISCRTLGKSRK